MRDRYHFSPKELTCEFEHVGEGIFKSICRVFASGTKYFHIDGSKTLGFISVATLGADALASRVTGWKQEIDVNTTWTCKVISLDKYNNPVAMTTGLRAQYDLSGVNAIHKAQVQYQFFGEYSHKVSFKPQTIGTYHVKAFLQGTVINGMPLHISVIAGQRTKFELLTNHLRRHWRKGVMSTVTVDRKNLLPTALHLFQGPQLEKEIRVRFGSEPGIDASGVSR